MAWLLISGKDCGQQLTPPQRGSVSYPYGSKFQAEAEYSCSPGYVLCSQCTSKVVCTSQGVWEETDPPTCEGELYYKVQAFGWELKKSELPCK